MDTPCAVVSKRQLADLQILPDRYLTSEEEIEEKIHIEVKQEAAEDDAAVEQDDADLYHSALGLHTECDIPLDIVKEELDDVDTKAQDDNSPSPDLEDVTATNSFIKVEIEADNEIPGAPVSKKPRLTTQMNYEDTPADNLTGSDQTKDNIEEPKSETKGAVEDKPIKKNKIVETRDKIDIRLRNNKQNDSTIDLGEKPYECDVCKKCFIQKNNLDRHTRTHTGEKPYQCHLCDKSFSQKNNLDMHMRTHTGEKPYECNVCKKSFKQKVSLDGHMRAHTGEKHPHQCNICKKCFYQKSNLNRHTRTHTGEKPYQCYLCDKSFSQKISVDMHMLTHTGEKRYECNVCKKCFKQKANLVCHMRAHTGEKHPHQCNICKKYFSKKSYLNIHTRTHAGEKPYECNVCKCRFKHKVNLDIHNAYTHWRKTSISV